MAKFPEADVRKFKNVFISRKSKRKVRTTNARLKVGKTKCPRTGSKAFRTIRKK